MKRIAITTSSIPRITNKAPEVPSTPAPVAATPPPTIDDSEEVKKQRLLEEQRQKRAQGLASTDNTGGEGVALQQENIEKPAAKTLLGE
jgi:hypothetical protein